MRLTDAIWAALNAQSITVVAEAAWGDTITELAADLDRICARRDQLAAQHAQHHPQLLLGALLRSLRHAHLLASDSNRRLSKKR